MYFYKRTPPHKKKGKGGKQAPTNTQKHKNDKGRYKNKINMKTMQIFFDH